MANVFVSHRGPDTALAEKLGAAIQAAGHRVWLDHWEINIGDSIVGRMNEGLTGASFVVLCYSEHGVETPWISAEWMSALARQLNGAGVKILPVRLSGGVPPAILADLRYADLAADWPAGLEQLLRSIR